MAPVLGDVAFAQATSLSACRRVEPRVPRFESSPVRNLQKEHVRLVAPRVAFRLAFQRDCGLATAFLIYPEPVSRFAAVRSVCSQLTRFCDALLQEPVRPLLHA